MDKAELGAVLASWRARIRPEDVGLPTGARRRTPGLRREEVASLAGISVDYLTRLEQGRGPRPSDAVLSGLARALRVSDVERDHLFRLAGSAPPLPTAIPGTVRPSVQRLLDRFEDLPAMLLDAKGSLLAWNRMATALLGDFSAWPPDRRNITWQRFLGHDSHIVASPEEEAETDRALVGELRATLARYPDDTGLRDLVHRLRTHSARFEELWQRRLPAARHSARKRIAHPELGVLELDCEALHVPDSDQRLVVYSAPPRTPEAEALALLRVIGTQHLTVAPPAEGPGGRPVGGPGGRPGAAAHGD